VIKDRSISEAALDSSFLSQSERTKKPSAPETRSRRVAGASRRARFPDAASPPGRRRDYVSFENARLVEARARKRNYAPHATLRAMECVRVGGRRCAARPWPGDGYGDSRWGGDGERTRRRRLKSRKRVERIRPLNRTSFGPS
jgi:hypothetical protein